MENFIALLRGINVSGHNVIRMARLQDIFKNLGFRDIRTYLQSGNVVFRTMESDPSQMERAITAAISLQLGLEVPALVLSTHALDQIVKKNPWQGRADMNPAFFHVTFLSGEPGPCDPALLLARKHVGEDLALFDRVVYLYCPQGYGQSKLTNTFLEKTLGTQATTRNWKTTLELWRMASDAV